jgi:peptidoglycan hydrolase-like protein with peptidoglycan-binding domain
VLLMFLDIDPGAIDGLAGKRTRSAVVRFREQNGFPGSDQIDDQLIAALLTSVGSASVSKT